MINKVHVIAGNPFHGLEALKLTVQLLWIHSLIVLVISIICTLLAYCSVSQNDIKPTKSAWFFNRTSGHLTMACLGFVMAYFIFLGYAISGNMLLSGLAPSLVALVSGGIAYFENDRAPETIPIRTAVASFLLASVICYQTLYFQKNVLWYAVK